MFNIIERRDGSVLAYDRTPCSQHTDSFTPGRQTAFTVKTLFEHEIC